MPTSRDFRIGILKRRHNARNARDHNGIGARRRLAAMRARLERNIEGGTGRRPTGTRQRLGLGMRPTAVLGGRAADDDRRIAVVADNHRAHRRVGPRASEPAPAKRKRLRHELYVAIHRRHAPDPNDAREVPCKQKQDTG